MSKKNPPSIQVDFFDIYYLDFYNPVHKILIPDAVPGISSPTLALEAYRHL